MLRAVGSCYSPKPAPPLSCFENKTTSRWVFLLGWQATSAQMQQVVLGYMIPVAEVTTHISLNTKLLFIDLVGNSDLTLHENYIYASISETMKGAYLLQHWLLHLFYFLYSKPVKSTLTNSAGPRGMQQK